MRLCLNILLILVSLLACYAEDLYLYFRPLKPDQTVAMTLRCQQAFDFNQHFALQEKRRLALKQYEPLYLFLTENADKAKAKITRLIEKVYGMQSAGKTNTDELVAYLNEEFGVKLDRGLAGQLLRYEDLVKLFSGILTIEDTILQRNILNDRGSLAGKSTIEVLHPPLTVTTTVPTGELLSLEEARLLFQERAGSLFWQVDRKILDAVLQISLSTLLPTLQYDDQANHQRVENIVRKYPFRTIHYAPGDILVAIGKAPGDEGVIRVAAYQDQRSPSLYRSYIWNLTAIIFTVILFNLFFSRLQRNRTESDNQRRFLLKLMILLIVCLKAFLLTLPFPVSSCILALFRCCLSFQSQTHANHVGDPGGRHPGHSICRRHL
jgi:membrane-associated HD superfamily phosphohydrolase